ncbi:MAG: AMP-binding protein [Acidobacteriota bacterium]
MIETADPERLRRHQLDALRRLVDTLVESNPFYGPKLRDAGLADGIDSLDHFTGALPITSKDELVADQRAHPPYGTNQTFPLDRYVRFHQTSGTTGRPMRWLDTTEDWQWMVGHWRKVFEACGVDADDRILFPFSFGPFLGFWTAFDAAASLGALALPGGGLPSSARLRLLIDNQATAVCCTPTYAIRLGEVARQERFDLITAPIAKVIVAGEPGGGVEAVRRRIAELWGAEVFDHHGMTEVGPVSYPSRQVPGVLHVIGSSYLAEILDLDTGRPVQPGATGELILTTLGRVGMPLLRYRTGDLVRVSEHSPETLGTADPALDGGILARADDMVVVRGVNLYPAAIDRVVRGFSEVAEYRVELRTARSMVEMRIEIEPRAEVDPDGLCRRIADALRNAFSLRLPVAAAEPGSLPRFELKAKRWHRIEEPAASP